MQAYPRRTRSGQNVTRKCPGHREEEARLLIAQDLYAEGAYAMEDDHVYVFDDETVTCVPIGTKHCHCIAASHHITWLCSIVLELVAGQQATASYVPDEPEPESEVPSPQAGPSQDTLPRYAASSSGY